MNYGLRFMTSGDSSRREYGCGYFAAALLMMTFNACPIVAGVLDIPFDFSRGAIGIDATVKEAPEPADPYSPDDFNRQFHGEKSKSDPMPKP